MRVAAPKVPVVEVDGEGFLCLLEQRVTIFTMNYIYTGKLVGVNDSCVKLEDAYIVYETGEFSTKTWKDAQKLPSALYVQLSSVEAFTLLK